MTASSPGAASRTTPSRAAVVVLAAGSGSRVGADSNKVLLPVGGRPVVAWSVRDARTVPGVTRIVVVVRAGEEAQVSAALGAEALADPRLILTPGGENRHASEWCALRLLAPEIASGDVALVAIHDAARPWAGAGLFADVLAAAQQHGGAIPVLEAPDLVTADGSPVPGHVVAVQTPQAFRAGPLLTAYAAAERAGFTGTDTASCLEAFAAEPLRVVAVRGDPANTKITFARDLTDQR